MVIWKKLTWRLFREINLQHNKLDICIPFLYQLSKKHCIVVSNVIKKMLEYFEVSKNGSSIGLFIWPKIAQILHFYAKKSKNCMHLQSTYLFDILEYIETYKMTFWSTIFAIFATIEIIELIEIFEHFLKNNR